MPELGAAQETMPPPPPVEEWRGFEIEAEPESLGAGSEFALEETAQDWRSDTYLPESEPMFELEEPAAGPDVFGFEPLAAEAAPELPLSPFSDTERLGVPEPAAPLVGSLEETERRIEAPPPVSFEQSHEPAAAATPAATTATPEITAPLGNGLSDADVDRIARRIIELLGDKAIRDVAWEVVPDLAEVVIRDRLRELESQAENLA
jgi:hypothetical protein